MELLLVETLLFRDRRHHHWADRVGRFALFANANLLLRIPLIELYVGRLGLPPRTSTPSRASRPHRRRTLRERASAPVAPAVAGCDRHYGTATVCGPAAFRAEVRKTTEARCAWMAARRFPQRMKVHGSDPPRHDADGDGATCWSPPPPGAPPRPRGRAPGGRRTGHSAQLRVSQG
ncbi:hypothetical protein ACFYZT_10195 [Streptomyces sp. NPDC001591]|uniref:hypothetical protein n=1 Tax=Streptomyces sp. NPDC001591 TaxID=3364589 RepID=UPI0036B8B742